MNSKRKIVIVAIIALTFTAAILLPAQPAAAETANLIQNGSFETYTKDPGTWNQPNIIDFNLDVGNTDIANWTVINGKIDYVQYSSYTWRAADGERSLDLCGTPGSGGISQTFATVVGATYEVQFSMSGSPKTGWSGEDQPNKTLRVQAAGQSADFSFDVGAEQNSPEDMKWKSCTFQFIADSNSTTLEIFSTMESLHIGPVFDNVSVVPVQDWPLAGAWIGWVPPMEPTTEPAIIQETFTPLDPAGDRLAFRQQFINADPTFLSIFPEADNQSHLIGEAVKTERNTYEFTIIGYGFKTLPADRGQLKYIWVTSGTTILTDRNTRQDTDLYLSLYGPDKDVNPADGLPDEGAEPDLCLGPFGGVMKRVPLMPPCVPPPPPAPAPE